MYKLIKVTDLTNISLDWAVAKCEGKTESGIWGEPQEVCNMLHLHYCDRLLNSAYNPSVDWYNGGPIIYQRKIGIWTADGDIWHAKSFVLGTVVDGHTPLVAAMRCYVISELGYEIEIPVWLV